MFPLQLIGGIVGQGATYLILPMHNSILTHTKFYIHDIELSLPNIEL